MPPNPLTNFEIQKKYQNEPTFNGVYSRNNFSKIKNRTYIINLGEFKSIGTHVNSNNVIYFDSFGVKQILKENRKFIGNKNIITSFYRIQAYNSIMCEYFCVEFVDFMLKGKILLDYTNLFFPTEYEKNDKIILRYFQ